MAILMLAAEEELGLVTLSFSHAISPGQAISCFNHG